MSAKRDRNTSVPDARARSARRLPLAACVVAAVMAAAGCNGHARLEAISLSPNAIDPPAPEPLRLDAHRCHWWTNDAGKLCIAMEFDAGRLFVPAPESKLVLSLVFAGMPVGTGRNYIVGRNDLRAVYNAGLQHDRFVAVQGVCAVLRDPDFRTLHGSFRIWVIHQPGPGLFDLFPRQPGPLLLVGRFDAVPDSAGTGRSMLTATEAGGWTRPASSAPAATQPATAGSKR